MRSLALLAAVATMAMPAGAAAQSWRTAELARQLRDTAQHQVRVNYAAGRFSLQPLDSRMLYEAFLRYDEERSTPDVSFDPDERSLSLELDWQSENRPRGSKELGELRLGLTRHAPLDLMIELGAAQADIAVGGMALRRLRVQAGASESRVSFDRPNRVAMQSLDLHAGAAGLRAVGLANARASEIRIAAGVGGLELDFGGEWTQDIDASIDVAVGRVRLVVPRNVGVRVEMSRVLTKFDHPGFTRDGSAWVSENWSEASHRLTLRINTAFGTIRIDRGD